MRWSRTRRPSSPTRSIPVFGLVSVSTPMAVMSWSRATCSAMLKLARSGSTSGRVSTASLIAIRKRLVGDQQRVDLLRHPARGAGAQYPSAQDGGLELEVRGLDLPPLVVERHDVLGWAGGVEDGGDQPVDLAAVPGVGADRDGGGDDADLESADAGEIAVVAQPPTDREMSSDF